MIQNDLAGYTFGQYRILAKIGSGGMATVYKAWQPSLQRYVAIKILLPHLSNNAQFVRRFQQEAIIAARLNHPNIVTIHEVGQIREHLFIVMEYVDGRSLSEIILQARSLPLERVIHILRQVAEALDYAHQNHIVHRDIKPGNILVTVDDRVVVTDFGIAKALAGSGVTEHLTATGTIVGTPAYMSPEQILGQEVDYRSDLYSMGIICYEMLGGRPPFSGTTTATVLYTQVHTPPPPIRQLNPSVPVHVERALDRLLAKNPDDRFPNASMFVDDLEGKVTPRSPIQYEPQTVGYSEPTRSGTLSERQRSPSKLVWGGIGVALVLALVLVGLYLLLTGHRSTVPTLPAGAEESIAFTSERDGNAEIYVMNSDGSGQMNLTNSPVDDYYPAWSPDGTQISFHSYALGPTAEGRVAQIYLIDLSTNQMRLVDTGIDDAKFAAWSPDGHKLVFSGKDHQTWHLYIFDLTTGARQQITTGPADDLFPAWSSDGAKIAFTRAEADDREIYVMNVDGSDLRNVSNSLGWDWHPSWSPDSQKIAFTGQRTGSRQIFVMNADGSGQRQLLNIPGVQNMEPKWSRDGSTLVFSSDQSGSWDIYTINVDETHLLRLTSNTEHDYNPSWR